MTKMSPHIDVTSILAQTVAPAGQGAGTFQFLFLPLMLVGMYFLFVAPQRKKQKELQKAIDSLETGDEVLTAGGIYGEITNRKDDRFVIRISDNTKVEVAKSFIQGVSKKAAK